ncbi:unnamed protein product [Laminaria digitata]
MNCSCGDAMRSCFKCKPFASPLDIVPFDRQTRGKKSAGESAQSLGKLEKTPLMDLSNKTNRVFCCRPSAAMLGMGNIGNAESGELHQLLERVKLQHA